MLSCVSHVGFTQTSCCSALGYLQSCAHHGFVLCGPMEDGGVLLPCLPQPSACAFLSLLTGPGLEQGASQCGAAVIAVSL
jgi:hypothetical protein